MRIAAVVGSAICFTVLLVSCMKQATPPPGAPTASIEGVKWYLTEVGGSPVSPTAGDKQPHILLDAAETQVRGFAGCNHFFGSYELDGSSLTFGPMGATRMACPDLETGLETSVFDALERTRKWKIEGGDLLLLDADAVLARFGQEKYISRVGPELAAQSRDGATDGSQTYRTKTGKTIIVSQTHPAGRSLATIEVRTEGFQHDFSEAFEDRDPVSDVFTADLDGNGFDEIYK